jgi:hypothetical protein
MLRQPLSSVQWHAAEDQTLAMPDKSSSDELVFEVATPLGFTVRVSRSHWTTITTIKHPVMAGREAIVQNALTTPDEIRISRSDEAVHLFYKAESERRWACAVAKRLNGEGFLITAYPTDAIKEGERIWPK